MTEREALLAAIVANPDEDTVRLAYADWLDEQPAERVPCPKCRGYGFVSWDGTGLPRTAMECPSCIGRRTVSVATDHDLAEFIRVQCRLPHLKMYHGVPVRSDGRCPCDFCRSAELLDLHRRDWRGGPKCGACRGAGLLPMPKVINGSEWCPTCHGTGYACWPLAEVEHRENPQRRSELELHSRITSHFRRGFVARVELKVTQFTEETARLIFTHHPIEEVALTDAVCVPTYDEDSWTAMDRMSHPTHSARGPTQEAALAALSAECVRWARGLTHAGVPV